MVYFTILLFVISAKISQHYSKLQQCRNKNISYIKIQKKHQLEKCNTNKIKGIQRKNHPTGGGLRVGGYVHNHV